MYRNQKIILLHSEEEDKLPENLELGELAVNCFKDKEFICLKNTDNQLVKITPNGGGAGNSTSSVYNSINIGNNNLIQSGEYNRVEGRQNYIDGNFNNIKGSDNFIDRKCNNVDLYGSDNSVSNVHNGLVSGYKIKTVNDKLISNICAIGSYLQVTNTNEVAFGYGNESLKDNGQGGLIKGDGTVFAVGNGVQDMNGMLFKRHNALTVKTNGEILIQESPMTDKRNNTVVPPMISLQSLIARIKTLEEEVNRLKNK